MPIRDRFEVAVVPFPFVDAPAAERRPAPAPTAAAFARANGHGVFATVTTAKGSAWPSDVPPAAWREAGPTAPSVLRWKPFTLAEGDVLDRVGRLAAGDEAAAARGLAPLLGPTAPPVPPAPA